MKKMDPCKHCTVRGNLSKCLETKCNYHDLWMVKEIKRIKDNDIVMQGMLLDAIENVIDGGEASDFELSFPIVRKLTDLFISSPPGT